MIDKVQKNRNNMSHLKKRQSIQIQIGCFNIQYDALNSIITPNQQACQYYQWIYFVVISGVIIKVCLNIYPPKHNSHFNVLKFNVGATVVNLKVNYQIAQTKMINETLLLCKFDTS